MVKVVSADPAESRRHAGGAIRGRHGLSGTAAGRPPGPHTRAVRERARKPDLRRRGATPTGERRRARPVRGNGKWPPLEARLSHGAAAVVSKAGSARVRMVNDGLLIAGNSISCEYKLVPQQLGDYEISVNSMSGAITFLANC